MGEVGKASCRADVPEGCWCFSAEAQAVSAGPLWAQTQVTPLLLRLPSTLYLLGHLGHQFPSTTLQTVISEARLPWGVGGF